VTATLAAFAIISLPMLGVVQNGPQIAAVRYTYHAAPALAMLAGIVLLARSRIVPTLGVVAVIALGALTWNQSKVWRDTEHLWARVLSQDSASSIGHSAMASFLFGQDRVEEAIEHSKRAVALAPGYPEAHNDLGVGFAKLGRIADAIAEYQSAISLQPTYDEAHANLGVALAQTGDVIAAITHYRRALELNPDNSNAHVDLGNAYVRLGRSADAIEEYRLALNIRENNADARHNWGVALARDGKYADAIEQFKLALSINPGHTEAKQYLERATSLLQGR
jgi:tetratricopeptide (TPR) repeat protein